MMNHDMIRALGTVAIIGGGKMGEAVTAGLLAIDAFDRANVVVVNPGQKRRDYLSRTYGVSCVEDAALLDSPTTIVLAVKPQIVRGVAEDLVRLPGFAPVRVISVAAGISTDTLGQFFTDTALVRVMPNTPLLVGAGMCTVSVGSRTSLEEGELVCSLFQSMGEAILIDESLQDAAGAISGSGPAYYALLVRELAAAGAGAGLADDDALLLAERTLWGTAQLFEKTGQTPQQLINAVTSPKGTTLAALKAMDEMGLAQAVDAGVSAAIKRSKELA